MWRERPCLPDPVGVPLRVDNDLLGAEGDGAGLVVVLQVVLAQVHSVGVAAAAESPQETQKAAVRVDTETKQAIGFYE